MGRLFKNEWIKLKYSKMLWILYGVILVYVILTGGMPTGTMGWGEYGATAPYGYLRSCGTLVMMFLSPMVGIFFTQEFAQGTMHNTLSCGVSRRDYFMVKLVCVLISGYLVYFCSLLVFTGIRCLVAGYRPSSGICPPCGLRELLVYQAGCCVQEFTYITFFLLVSVISKKTAIVNLVGLVVWWGEAMLSLSVPAFKGPTSTIISSFELWESGKVLTMEFVKQYGQCAVMSIVFLALAYFIFLKRDIN